jgi:hypothetical protein
MNAHTLVNRLLEANVTVLGKASKTSKKYLKLYAEQPKQVQQAADDAFAYWCVDPGVPTLNFERIMAAPAWHSVRIGARYRAICYNAGNMWIWHWIGTHEAYNALIAGRQLIRNWPPPPIPSL